MFKKKLVIICIAAVVLCATLFCGCTDEENPYDYQPVDSGFEIADLSVEIDASKGDRSMVITESYEFYYRTPNHGFYRDFALNSGEKIRNLKVLYFDDFYNTYEISYPTSKILRVKVGSASNYVKGTKRCTFKYTMITPEYSRAPDALAINAIGSGWTCKIARAQITVKLPQATDRVPEYIYGRYGETNNAVGSIVSQAPQSGKSEYSFTVEPPYEGGYALDGYEGLTLYYYMPKGAFKTYTDWQFWIILAIAVLLVGATLALKFTMGTSRTLTPVTQYYPPKHVGGGERDLPMDPLDIGYLIDNTCQAADVTSLIFYFASMGYIQLIEPNSGDNPSADFMLVKVCDLPDGLPKYQYTFFNKLFSFGDRITVSQLTNRTYSTVQTVQNSVRQKYSGKLYDGKVRAVGVTMSVLTVLFAFFTVFLSGLRVNTRLYNVFGAFAAFPVIISAVLGMYLVYNWLKLGRAKRIAVFIGCVLATAVASLLLIALTHRDSLGIADIIVITAAVTVCAIISPFIARRTEYYDRELNNVLGFKEFLQTAEKDKLETLLEENPQYYYDILPYANVLGVSSVWEDKFKNLTLEPPVYYSGRVFVFATFNSYYRRSYRSYSTASVSRPSSSSHSGGRGGFGGGGGGGFSGGGFGGGGGGRW